jgi:environmental stress-induced protein Ves
MSVHYFDRAALTPMPWKNGGGVTREIACYPPGAGMNDFEWRVSIATIAADGPFSVFDGVDRVITLLEGAGMNLRSTEGRIDHVLSRPLVPFAFRGEAAVDCTLIDGRSNDFNVMTRRGKMRANVRVLSAPQITHAYSCGLFMVTEGTWDVEVFKDIKDIGLPETRKTLDAGHGMWWSDEMVSWRLSRVSPDATMIAVELIRNIR